MCSFLQANRRPARSSRPALALCRSSPNRRRRPVHPLPHQPQPAAAAFESVVGPPAAEDVPPTSSFLPPDVTEGSLAAKAQGL